MSEPVAAAQASPGKVTYGSWAVGSPGHLGAAQVEAATGTQMLHVPFKDTAQLYAAVANGDVTWALGSYATAGALIQAGKLRVLAVADGQRSSALPEVPTLEEAGGPRGVDASTWVALVAPAGTPAERVDAISRAVRAALEGARDQDQDGHVRIRARSRSRHGRVEWMRKDTPRYAEMVRRTGATTD